jgi:hypothetical protein
MQNQDLDEALRREPTWNPPEGFARSVVLRVASENLQWPAVRQPRVSFGRGLVLGALAAVGGSAVERLIAVATPELLLHPVPAVWTCALLSFAVAASLTCRVLRA